MWFVLTATLGGGNGQPAKAAGIIWSKRGKYMQTNIAGDFALPVRPVLGSIVFHHK